METIDGTPFPNMYQTPENEKEIYQGDIIKRVVGECDLEIASIEIAPKGYLLVSNSCDLHRGDKRFISFVPIYPFSLVHEKFISSSLRRASIKGKKEQSAKKDFNFEEEFISQVSNFIFEESNYKRKSTFFLSPLKDFDGLPAIALIENVGSIGIGNKETLLRNRLVSLKGPWREKLGYMVGNLYNRVATHTPETKDIRVWWKSSFPEKCEEAKDRFDTS